MPQDFNIFIREPGTMDQVLECLGLAFGHELTEATQVEWRLYQTRLLGFDIAAFEQADFVDDQGIPFSQYSCVVSLAPLWGFVEKRYESEWRVLFAKVLASFISQRLACECIVVENLQVLIATFGPDQETKKDPGAPGP
jgi:hypothetical protein